MIRAGDKLSTVLARDERLLEVLAAAAPAFEQLRNPGSRRTMAHLVTVEQAAQIAGLDPAVLVERLNRALDEDAGDAPTVPERPPVRLATPPVPPALLATPRDRLIDLDVREELRAGREPFARIMAVVKALGPDAVLRLHAIFEPAPLYAVLARHGLAHVTERLADDDWRVWFYRDGAATAPAPSAAAPAADADDVLVVDVRDLEPPEPMVRTLEALATLPRGKTLVQLNVRVPQLLLPRLEERGFTYEIREQSPDLVRLFIRHR